MTRRRVAHWLTPVFAILAIAVCVVSFSHRARAGSAQSKRSAIRSVQTAALDASGKPVVVIGAGAHAPPATTAPAAASSNTEASTAAKPEQREEAAGRDQAAPAGAAADSPAASGEPSRTGTAADDLTSIPTGSGLPVMVSTAVAVLEVQSFDDVKGEFEATTDLRLRWSDTRLRFASTGVASKYTEYRGKAAEERLEKLWVPNVDIANRIETSGYVGHRLRIFADGQVETIVRATGRFKTDVDVQQFPFDKQGLKQTLIVRDQTTDEVVMQFDKEDQEFSRAFNSVRLDSWQIGDVELAADSASGWNGDRYSRVTASLVVTRYPSTGLTTIFIPLLASLLIPLLALWMNRTTPEGFEVEAFELANMGIGGLFSVIALSYAVSSAYSSIAGSDNTVTRLFALNYATLAIALTIVVLFFQCNVVLRRFGPYVHEQAFRFVLWALPLLTLATSVAFVLIAAC
jgi:hypothetical protein